MACVSRLVCDAVPSAAYINFRGCAVQRTALAHQIEQLFFDEHDPKKYWKVVVDYVTAHM